MKFLNKNFHQGDVQLFAVDRLPEGIQKVEKQFIAASERSGSFHALFGNYDMYSNEDGTMVLDVKEDCVLNHSLETELRRSGVDMNHAKVIEKKDHRHTIVPKGIYFVGIQQRFDPLAGFRKKVED